MKAPILAGLLAVGVMAGDAAAQNPAAPVAVEAPIIDELPLIVAPVWIIGPADFDRAPFYPAVLTAGEAAAVELECRVLPNGFLSRCEPRGEPAPGRPFVIASLRVTANLRLTPPSAPEPPSAPDPDAPPAPIARVRVQLDWTPPVDRAAAAGRLTRARVGDLPDWETGGSDYPGRAAQEGIESGRAQVMCIARVNGRLEECSVLNEEPPGFDFGWAARRSVSRKRVTPSMVDGRPVDDVIVTPVHFSLAPEP